MVATGIGHRQSGRSARLLPPPGHSPYKSLIAIAACLIRSTPDRHIHMLSDTFRRWMFLALAGLALAGCAQFERKIDPAVTANAAQEDDAYCRREAGEPGSARYAECLKVRDEKRAVHDTRIERTHRHLSEQMLNGR